MRLDEAKAVYLGSTPVPIIYRGTVPVYTSAPPARQVFTGRWRYDGYAGSNPANGSIVDYYGINRRASYRDLDGQDIAPIVGNTVAGLHSWPGMELRIEDETGPAVEVVSSTPAPLRSSQSSTSWIVQDNDGDPPTIFQDGKTYRITLTEPSPSILITATINTTSNPSPSILKPGEFGAVKQSGNVSERRLYFRAETWLDAGYSASDWNSIPGTINATPNVALLRLDGDKVTYAATSQAGGVQWVAANSTAVEGSNLYVQLRDYNVRTQLVDGNGGATARFICYHPLDQL